MGCTQKTENLKVIDVLKYRERIKKSNGKALCTTDNPADDLQYHIKILKDKKFNVKVLPTFRPDKAIKEL